MKEILIEVKNLQKRFSSSAAEPDVLRNINLQVRQGEIYGIIGMSGAGKSTLIRCLSALEQPTAGSILIGGQEIAYKNEQALRTVRQQMGMIFQHFHLFSSRTAARNVAYPLEIYGVPLDQQNARVDELLALVGLEGKKNAYPSQLSGGEKQRVAIARALAHHPQILLCDEPTSALDPKTNRSLLQLLLQLNQKLGLTIVIITHQLEVIQQICHRVAVLSHGEIVEEGSVRDVFTRPSHPVTRHLLHLDIDQIPEDLRHRRDPNKTLVRLDFEGNQAKEPVLSQMIRQHDVEANILSGGLNYLQQTVVGHLFVELSGSSEEIQRALNFLIQRNIHCEVMS